MARLMSLSEQAIALLRATMAAHVPPLTIKTLAEKAGVSTEAVAKVLRNKHDLQMETFERYLTAAGGQVYLVTTPGGVEYSEADLDPYAFQKKIDQIIQKGKKL